MHTFCSLGNLKNQSKRLLLLGDAMHTKVLRFGLCPQGAGKTIYVEGTEHT